ncbi:N-acyl amino acid synthase FeeM domain-containing protein [Engelhardtia mirabilis]|uniref:N-acyl amino acid synthase FeeM catalytic core domain-containing protein n=1 Tax=Engelhardtia mirabilis TaxID=2528011 RepID=A0A518BKB8_9BACT|nr:hypothetical protein Pla133_25020 [Planctomycetes bacterium Pla133]QDV01745.1 hypothetical protein Pla86_25010 [Planctomycetes bacterium Pla86]
MATISGAAGPTLVRIDSVPARGASAPLIFEARPSAARLLDIFTLRQTEYRAHSDYLLGNRAGRHPAEDDFDADAYQFCCTIGDEVVAACRYSPALDGRWEASGLCPLPAGIRDVGDSPLQISRVVVRADMRRRLITEVMLCLACRWLLEFTSHRSYFALCLPKLARYYEHFGAHAIEGGEVVLASRQGQLYHFVRGRMDTSDRVITEFLELHESNPWSLPVRTERPRDVPSSAALSPARPTHPGPTSLVSPTIERQHG